jgi:hypothetical protein
MSALNPPLYTNAHPWQPGCLPGSFVVAWSESDIAFDATLLRGVHSPRELAELALWFAMMASCQEESTLEQFATDGALAAPSAIEVEARGENETAALASDEDDEDDEDGEFTEKNLRKLYLLLSDWVVASGDQPWEDVEVGFRRAMEAAGAGYSETAGGYGVGGWTLAIASWTQVLSGSGILPENLRSEVIDRWDEDDDWSAYEEDQEEGEEDEEGDGEDEIEDAPADGEATDEVGETDEANAEDEDEPAWTDPKLPVPDHIDEERFIQILENYAQHISGG